jgi:hypothetical protein
VASANDGFHSGHPLNPRNSLVQISDTEQQMIHSRAGGYQAFTRIHCLSKPTCCAGGSAQA